MPYKALAIDNNNTSSDNHAAADPVVSAGAMGSIPDLPAGDTNGNMQNEPSKLYLSTFVNDRPGDIVVEFIEAEDGRLFAAPGELRMIGLASPRSAYTKDGLVDISLLPDVRYDYDEEEQIIRFHATDDAALMPYELNLSSRRMRPQSLGRAYLEEKSDDDDTVKAQSDFAAVLNYSLYTDTGSDKFSDLWHFSGLSGSFEGRLTGRFGTLSSSHVVRFSSSEYQDTSRLDTYWSYWDPKHLTSYRVGDLVTGSLPWTSSVRLGGIQIRRNFQIRDDLVTMPLPSFSGSAAVPSSVDVYINNMRRSTSEVPSGPWRLTDLPVVSGTNTARLVVKDALGRETVTEVPFYASSNMLAKGLVDFSFEAGVPRYGYSSSSGDYSHDIAATGTVRYGLSNKLTLEAHGEYTKDFYNGGLGTLFTIGPYGMMTLSGSTSSFEGQSGQQAAVSIELQRWGIFFNASSLRTFGNYTDLGSATSRRTYWRDEGRGRRDHSSDSWEEEEYARRRRGIKSLHRVSLGVPLKIDPTTLNLSYTQGEYYDAAKTQYLSFSASRRFGKRVHAHINAYKDFSDNDRYGIFAGMSISFDKDIRVSSNVSHDKYGTSYETEISQSKNTSAIGGYSWRLRDSEGKRSTRSFYGSYRARIANVDGSIEQNEDSWRLTASMDGSIVAAGGGVFAANRIDNSFAVVNTGARGVSVLRNNNVYGKTGWNGKLLVPGLSSYHTTRISIKADDLPFDTAATTTEMEVKPAYHAAVVVNFATEKMDDSILMSVIDEYDNPVELGSLIETQSGEELATIGYDGQALLPLDGVKLPASFVVQRTNGEKCRLDIPRTIARGITSGVTEVRCTPM